MEKFSYLSRTNLEYLESLHTAFTSNPNSVDPEWRLFFEGMEFAKSGTSAGEATLPTNELNVFRLLQAYRDYGYLQAKLNPLKAPTPHPSLDLKNFGLKPADLEKSYQVSALVGQPKAKLKDVMRSLENMYCGTASLQVAECRPEVRAWFTKEFEASFQVKLSPEEKKMTLDQLLAADSLERFIHTRYVGTKRFSIEGADSCVPILETIIRKSRSLGAQEIVIGMAHRGRLNMLVNVFGKPVTQLFSEFDGLYAEAPDFDGDVKYHMGYTSVRSTPGGDVQMALAFNPSHLEAVNPVVCGMVRAKQGMLKDETSRKKVIPILVHGDAAFAGQGVVAETLQMSGLRGYTVGGTIHMCIDNQVGFTADWDDTRSTPYSSDIAKIVKAPVLHVNGDDAEACVKAARLALQFRQEFSEDVVINIICYRRFGHNEGDEPTFTQPVLYNLIKEHPTPRQIYATQLAREGIQSVDDSERIFQSKLDQLQTALDYVRKEKPKVLPPVVDQNFRKFRKAEESDFDRATDTKFSTKGMKDLFTILTTFPPELNIHPKMAKLLEDRKKRGEQGQVDWGTAELLAYATLLQEGISVRLSGQDVIRGTFSHRQSQYYDTQTNVPWSPLSTVSKSAHFHIFDSLLSEMAVVGFEYGKSITDPNLLVIWEAQFGDFCNGAQIIIDQFISSGEAKWNQMSGLVMLLPHGYEGQGPEHSSARFERFLQLCAQENIQVCNLSLPSQIYHVLRRQMKRDFKKPLVIMSPKSLLRHPKCLSAMTVARPQNLNSIRLK
ncbi:MAG: 2-oxoglutarate dehydrogenase E1 component, partial [Bdellovibrionales bacterium]|nr:2-oxoglutarate dehydrogenase E1 component [Bdellovibrionales bacterium]